MRRSVRDAIVKPAVDSIIGYFNGPLDGGSFGS